VNSIIQVVPYLPPTISGVGDYALLLAEELRQAHNIDTHFIVCNSTCASPPEVNGFRVSKAVAHSARSLEMMLNEQAGAGVPVLLHYVGYGYEKRGCPLWLVKGLDAWRSTDGRRRLVTMFHELFALGLPWQSSFWTSPLQRWLTSRLAGLSDSCITNTRRFARYVESRLGPHSQRVFVLPVFSNIGEPYLQGAPRRNEMVIFGSAGWREAAYTSSHKALLDICQLLNINKIHDIGPRLSVKHELPIEIDMHGSLPAPRVSEIMQNVRYGFFTYPSPFLAKSGIFAAYASHGLVPVTVDENNRTNEDQLCPDIHFLTSSSLAKSIETVSTVGEKVRDWYSNHCVAVQAQRYASILTENRY
jgi:hypothetical protein